MISLRICLISVFVGYLAAQDLFQCPGDAGYDGFSCEVLKDKLGTSKLCKNFAQDCCDTCGAKCKGNKDIDISGTPYTCDNALSAVFNGQVDPLCRVYGKDCCETCT